MGAPKTSLISVCRWAVSRTNSSTNAKSVVNESFSMGPQTKAPSSRRSVTMSISSAVVPVARVKSTRGQAAAKAARTPGSRSPAVVSMDPIASVPVGSASSPTTWVASLSNAVMRSAYGRKASPALVRAMPRACRRNSSTPSSSSSALMWVLTFDCTVCSRFDACEIPPASATARKCVMSLSSIAEVNHAPAAGTASSPVTYCACPKPKDQS
ncbi:Uncharacterised protein [Mycobacteroides abscessus subsp. abscessus]|nr:Uncharacterised protein [Mycobacteroides abscessus subsp. abscessus]